MFNPTHRTAFVELLGENNVLVGEVITPYTTEQRGRYTSTPAMVLLPDSVQQIQAVVRYCQEHRIGIVPQGGNTGLVGGSVASNNDIILNLKNLHTIRAVNAADYSLVADAGCTLSQVQTAAAHADRLFPLGLSVDDQCQLGGNIASNAGGLNTLRYGTAGEMTLGIEAVLPNGELVSSLQTVRKYNTGFSDKQLFIGTEGRFGIITGASVRLYPAIQQELTLLLSANTVAHLVTAYGRSRTAMNDQLSAFELISKPALELVRHYRPALQLPAIPDVPWYALVHIASSSASALLALRTMALGEKLFDKGCECVAASADEAKTLWQLRSEIPWVQRDAGASIKHDISLPLTTMATFIEQANIAVGKIIPGARPIIFGHMGDGNLHYNISQPDDTAKDAFFDKEAACHAAVHELVIQLGGSISAEHGVGLAKQAAVKATLSPGSLEIRRAIKQVIDPQNIMNPGKGI